MGTVLLSEVGVPNTFVGLHDNPDLTSDTAIDEFYLRQRAARSLYA